MESGVGADVFLRGCSSNPIESGVALHSGQDGVGGGEGLERVDSGEHVF